MNTDLPNCQPATSGLSQTGYVDFFTVSGAVQLTFVADVLAVALLVLVWPRRPAPGGSGRAVGCGGWSWAGHVFRQFWRVLGLRRGQAPSRPARRPGRWKPCVLLGALLLAGLGTTAYFRERRAASSGAPKRIVVLQNRLCLGTVWAERSFRWSLPLFNPTREEIRVAALRSSCACAEIHPTSFVLRPGRTVEVGLKLNLASWFDGDSASWERPFELEITPVFESHMAENVVWRLKGQIRRALRLSPPVVDFGDRLVRGHPHQPLGVTVHAFVPLEEFHIEYDKSRCRIETAGGAEALSNAGGTLELRVAVSPELPLGPFEMVGWLHGRTARGEHFPPVALRMRGKMVSPIGAYPETVHFGIRRAGETAAAELELFSRVGQRFRVRRVMVGDRSFGVSPSGTHYGLEHRFELTWRPRGAGEETHARITFQLETEAGEASDLLVPVSGYVWGSQSGSDARGEDGQTCPSPKHAAGEQQG